MGTVTYLHLTHCRACDGYGRVLIGERREGVALIRTTRRCPCCNGLGTTERKTP